MACPKCGYCEHCGRSNPPHNNFNGYLPYYPDSTAVPAIPFQFPMTTYIGPLPEGTTYTFNGKEVSVGEAKEISFKMTATPSGAQGE